jgi:hypothetical protein
MNDPFDQLAQQADQPIAPSDVFTQRLWDRLASDLATGSDPAPAPDITGGTPPVPEGATSSYLGLEQPPRVRPQRSRGRRWPIVALAGVAASIALGALIATRVDHTNTFKIVRLDPAATAFLTNLKADNNAYQSSVWRWNDSCLPGFNPASDPTSCRRQLENFAATIQTNLSHLDAAPPPASLAATVNRYRSALQAVADAARRALAAVDISTFQHANTALYDATTEFCGALDQLDGAGNGVVSVGRCPS